MKTPVSSKLHMSRPLRGLILGSLLVGLLSSISDAALPWEPVNQLWGPSAVVVNGSSSSGDVACDSQGNVYSVGNVTDAQGVTRGAVLKSTDAGASWASCFEPAPENDIAGLYLTGIAIAGDQIVVGGSAQNRCVVCRSVNAGADWEVIDAGQFLPTFTAQFVTDVGVDENGVIYLVGRGDVTTVTTTKKTTTTTTVQHWVVRKGVPDGTAYQWSTIDDISAARANAVTCTGTNVFVAGAVNGSWVVRKLDALNSWTQPTTYQMQSGYAAEASSITSDSAGNVYVAGRATVEPPRRTSNSTYWVVQKVGTAVPLDATLTSANSTASGIALDDQGRLQVVGWSKGDTTLVRWLVREGSFVNGVWSWSTTDAFAYAPDKWAQGSAIGAGPAGVYAIGAAAAVDGTTNSWVIRRKLNP